MKHKGLYITKTHLGKRNRLIWYQDGKITLLECPVYTFFVEEWLESNDLISYLGGPSEA